MNCLPESYRWRNSAAPLAVWTATIVCCLTAATIGQAADVVVASGVGQVDLPSPHAVRKGALISNGSSVQTRDSTLSATLPDGTLVTMAYATNVRFVGPTSAHPQDFSVDVLGGEVSLDTTKRNADAVALQYRLTTPLRTIVTFRRTIGSVHVGTAADRIVCNVCAENDIRVQSSTRKISLDKNGKVATVTPDKGIVVAVSFHETNGGMGIGSILGSILGAGGTGSVYSRSPRIDEVALEVRATGGDQALIDVCPKQAIQITVSGGQPPYRVTSDNPRVVAVTEPHSEDDASATARIAAKSIIPGRAFITANDTAGNSALLSVNVVGSSTNLCGATTAEPR